MAIAPLVIGIDLTALQAQLTEMENRIMTTQAEAFAAVTAQLADIKADLVAKLDALAAERENLSAAGQAAFDELVAAVSDLDVTVGDADGSDTPAEPEVPAEG